MRRLTILSAVMALALFAAVPAAAEHAAPLELTFEKDVVGEGLWAGTLAGEDSGTVEVALTDLTVKGPIWKVSFDWAVDGAIYDFDAEVSGVINTKTGRIVLNGVVISGDLTGSRVHVRAAVVNEDLSTAGTITITP